MVLIEAGESSLPKLDIHQRSFPDENLVDCPARDEGQEKGVKTIKQAIKKMSYNKCWYMKSKMGGKKEEEAGVEKKPGKKGYGRNTEEDNKTTRKQSREIEEELAETNQ